MKLTDGQQQAVSILYSISVVCFFFFLSLSGKCLAVKWFQVLTCTPDRGASWGGWELIIPGSDTSWTCWAVCQLGILSAVRFIYTGFFASHGIILSIAMQQSGKTLHRCFLNPVPFTWASVIGLYCMCCSGLPHWEFYEFHKEGICFKRKVFYWKVFQFRDEASLPRGE